MVDRSLCHGHAEEKKKEAARTYSKKGKGQRAVSGEGRGGMLGIFGRRRSWEEEEEEVGNNGNSGSGGGISEKAVTVRVRPNGKDGDSFEVKVRGEEV